MEFAKAAAWISTALAVIVALKSRIQHGAYGRFCYH